jgi:hypothetical protein
MILKVDNLWKIIGIVSAAAAKTVEIDGQKEKIGDLNNYMVYTDVSKFHEWINQVVLETHGNGQVQVNQIVQESDTIPPVTRPTSSFLEKLIYFFFLKALLIL